MLDLAKRAAYDERLRRELQAETAPPVFAAPRIETTGKMHSPRRDKTAWQKPAVLGVGVVVVIGLLGMFLFPGDTRKTVQHDGDVGKGTPSLQQADEAPESKPEPEPQPKSELEPEPDSESQPEPEPSTLILLGIGVIGLFAYGRRKRRR